MKVVNSLAIILLLVMCFQSCGDTSRNNVFFVDEYDQSSVDDCRSLTDCEPSPSLLWLKIGEFEPYKMPVSSLTKNYFIIGGKCGTGTYAEHAFRYRLIEGFGNQEIIGERVEENLCEHGQFAVPIRWNIKAPGPDQLYVVTLELVGIGPDGEMQTNPSPANKQSLDVMFTLD